MRNTGIYIIGLNHTTAPVDIREKYSFRERETENALLKLSSMENIDECMILSTCNRVEIYFVSRSHTPFNHVISFLTSEKTASHEEISKYFYKLKNEEAIKHAFRVAASLDSMIVGEPQIVGQFKDAFNIAKECGTSGAVLNRLCETALKVSKRIRTETGISKNAVSVSFAAVELAKKIFGSLTGKTVSIIGAGEMAELAVKHLVSNGVADVFVVNRTFKRAKELAGQFGGKAMSMEELNLVLKKSDIVISSTGARGYVIKYDEVAETIKHRATPIFLIDIAVPRDIDPEISNIGNVYLYDIDDLNSIVKANVEERKRAAAEAENTINTYVANFIRWMRELEVAPAIAELKNKAEIIRKTELNKRLQKLKLTQEQYQEIENITRIVINKILHEPITSVKKKAVEEEKHNVIQIFRELFGLGKE